MNKILVCFFLITSLSFSQESIIQTSSIEQCYILKKPKVSSNTLVKLKRGKRCEVLNYSGYEFWNVKYKGFNGYVQTKYLKINDEMKSAKRIFDSIFEIDQQRQLRLLKKLKEKERLEDIERKRIRSEKNSLRMVAINNSRRLDAEKRQKKLNTENQIKVNERRNNCHYKTNGIDEFDEIKIVMTEYYEIEESSGLFVSLKNHNGSKWVYISLNSDLGCASKYKSDRSFVKFKLTNNKIVTFYHNADIDCSKFTLIGRLTGSDISELKKSAIKSIRLQGTKYYEDVSNIDYSDFFIDKLKCID